VLLCFIDPRVRKIRNEASSCPGIFSRTLYFYYVASSRGSPLPHLLDGHRKLVGRSAIPTRSLCVALFYWTEGEEVKKRGLQLPWDLLQNSSLLQPIPLGVTFSNVVSKAQSSKLERLFSVKRGKTDVRASSFSETDSIWKTPSVATFAL